MFYLCYENLIFNHKFLNWQFLQIRQIKKKQIPKQLEMLLL